MIAREQQLYNEGIEKVKKLATERGNQYQSKESPLLEDYWVFGRMSIFSIVWIKILRLKVAIQNEATKDALCEHILDCINYLLFMYVHIRDYQQRGRTDS